MIVVCVVFLEGSSGARLVPGFGPLFAPVAGFIELEVLAGLAGFTLAAFGYMGYVRRSRALKIRYPTSGEPKSEPSSKIESSIIESIVPLGALLGGSLNHTPMFRMYEGLIRAATPIN